MTEKDWKSLDSPGYLGKHRDAKFAQWDLEHGFDRWRLAWKVGEIYTDFLGACALYEDAYFEFLDKSRYLQEGERVVWDLIYAASNVYDDELSNVDSGLDYTKQETGRTHIQDIAIRRCLVRMCRCFKGDKLIRIRQEKGDHPLSTILSPGNVPFHKPGLIEKVNREKQWWKPNSVEDFYQSNRVLQVRI